MKKGIIAISLLLSGVLLITPIANAISQNDEQKNLKPVIVEQAINTEKAEVVENSTNKTTKNENTTKPVKAETKVTENKVAEKEEVKVENEKEEIKKEETTNTTDNAVIEDDKEEVKVGMTKSEAEAILNKYIKDVEQGDFTYTYQGDENTFEAIKEKGIRGYVFLPNIETDMAYLIDKDNGSIYFFHPSGYFELLQ